MSLLIVVNGPRSVLNEWEVEACRREIEKVRNKRSGEYAGGRDGRLDDEGHAGQVSNLCEPPGIFKQGTPFAKGELSKTVVKLTLQETARVVLLAGHL